MNCDRAKYNVNTETGIFYNVRGTSETKLWRGPGCSPPTTLSTSKENGANAWMGSTLSTMDSSPIARSQTVVEADGGQVRHPSRRSRHHSSRCVPRQKGADFLFPGLLQIAKDPAAPERFPHAQHRTQLDLWRNVRTGILLGYLAQLRCALSRPILHAARAGAYPGIPRKSAARHRFQFQLVRGGRSRHRYWERRDSEAGWRGIHVRWPFRFGRWLDWREYTSTT